MTKEQVIAWARECGADVDEAANPAVYASFADMQRFAKLVRNAAMEEFEQSTPPDKTPFDTCPTCEALARAVMCDNVGKA